jgi:hypothetical protein
MLRSHEELILGADRRVVPLSRLVANDVNGELIPKRLAIWASHVTNISVSASRTRYLLAILFGSILDGAFVSVLALPRLSLHRYFIVIST